MTEGRDIGAEAQSWRDNLSKREDRAELYKVLEGLSDELLVNAYQLWWSIYSMSVRKAPSNLPGQGISASDASRAGHLATTATIEFFTEQMT